MLCVLCVVWPGVFLHAQSDLMLTQYTPTFEEKYNPSGEEKAFYDTFNDVVALVCLESVIKKREELKAQMQIVQNKIRTGQYENADASVFKADITDLTILAFFLESVEEMRVNKAGDVLLDSLQGPPLVLMDRIHFVTADNASSSSDEEGLTGEAQSCNVFFEETVIHPHVQQLVIYNMFEKFVGATNLLGVLKSLQVLEDFISEIGE